MYLHMHLHSSTYSHLHTFVPQVRLRDISGLIPNGASVPLLLPLHGPGGRPQGSLQVKDVGCGGRLLGRLEGGCQVGCRDVEEIVCPSGGGLWSITLHYEKYIITLQRIPCIYALLPHLGPHQVVESGAKGKGLFRRCGDTVT